MYSDNDMAHRIIVVLCMLLLLLLMSMALAIWYLLVNIRRQILFEAESPTLACCCMCLMRLLPVDCLGVSVFMLHVFDSDGE